MTVHKCPVCEGRQTVPAGFYDGLATGTAPEPCRTCNGKGAVAVEALPVIVPSVFGAPGAACDTGTYKITRDASGGPSNPAAATITLGVPVDWPGRYPFGRTA